MNTVTFKLNACTAAAVPRPERRSLREARVGAEREAADELDFTSSSGCQPSCAVTRNPSLHRPVNSSVWPEGRS